MNILRLSYHWPLPWDGLAPGPYELTLAQRDLGHQIKVYCGGWPRRSKLPISGVKVTRLPSGLRRLGPYPTTSWAALFEIVRQRRWTGIIHAHGVLPLWYNLWRPRSDRATHYVLHMHATAAGAKAGIGDRTTTYDFWTRNYELPLFAWADKTGCAAADAIICVSQSVRSEAITYYQADPTRLHVVPNGVNTRAFQPHGENVREHYGFAGGDRVILYVGGLRPIKRLDLLVETLGHLSSRWHLLLVGRGSQEASLRQQADQLNVTHRVHFAGYVPYPKLPAYYRSADVFALTSYSEGFPKVVLEALASGLPVVTTDSFAGDDYITGQLTYAAAHTPTAMADALQSSWGRDIDTAEICHRYDWHAAAEKIQAVYQQIK